MGDPRLAKMADTVVQYSVKVKPGDTVAINTHPVATPLVIELYRAILEAGGHPLANVSLPGTRRARLMYGSQAQIEWVSPFDRMIAEDFDVRISIDATTNTRDLSGVDAGKQALEQKSRRGLIGTVMDRAARGDMRWCVMLYPTDAFAQDADMSLPDFEDFVYHGCFLNADDPVAEWQRLYDQQERLINYLKDKREIRIVGDGTDLTLGVAGRHFINCAGDSNFPDGEFFTGPEETSVNGTVRFSFPAVYNGRQVEDVRLTFENGLVVEAQAKSGLDFLEQMLSMDEGARRLGEFAFGNNPNIQTFTKNILFDEKIGGTIHMALGAGYPESGSVNKSSLHWDMVCDLRTGGEIYVDGKLFAKDGAFVV